MQNKGLFITGTGTDVGKTMVSAWICKQIVSLGNRVLYYKPVQCGPAEYGGKIFPEGDHQVVESICGRSPLLETRVGTFLQTPVSPHRAFTLEGKKWDHPQFREDLFRSRANRDFILVEGAGGIRVPINESFEMTDIAKETSFPVLVVAHPGLGTLNHTLLTLEYLSSRRLPVAGFVFSLVSDEYSENSEFVQDNAQTIILRSGANFFGCIPQIENNEWPKDEKHPLALHLKKILT